MTDEQRAAEIARTAGSIAGIGRMAIGIPEEWVDALITQCENSEAFGPFADPTGWIRNHRAIRANKTVFEAFRTFRNVCYAAMMNEVERVAKDAERKG